ncbi:MAG: helix-turn-helix domain-containing protein [Spirochaetia bacterium]|nr:helix-turn-helix domain-containing protein [Spirochaetia bacterium]
MEEPLTMPELVKKRKQLHLTQARLARLIRVSANTVSRFERGVHNSLHLRVALTYVLECIENERPISDAKLRRLVLGAA